MSRTIFVGDIHGCPDEFRDLLDLLGYDPENDRLYLTGDSFARGADPGGAFDLIKQTGALGVLGNHDWKTLCCIQHRMTGAFPGEKFSESNTLCVDRMWDRRVEFRDYLQSLPLSIIGRNWVLAHAGVHPENGSFGTDAHTAMMLRTWPGPNIPGRPPWYESYNGDKLIIFGHDARGGLVRREKNGRPNVIGLDTGCVYGGELSAYILEQDRILQVPARRMYYDPVNKRHLT